MDQLKQAALSFKKPLNQEYDFIIGRKGVKRAPERVIRDASSRIISRLEPVLRPELAAVRDQTMLPEKRQHKARRM